jgi:hypothetical protein
LVLLLDDPYRSLHELDLAGTASAHRTHHRSRVASTVRKLGSAADAFDLDHGKSSLFALARIEHTNSTISWQTGERPATFSRCG